MPLSRTSSSSNARLLVASNEPIAGGGMRNFLIGPRSGAFYDGYKHQGSLS